MAGGAANTAANLAALGARVDLLAVFGDDGQVHGMLASSIEPNDDYTEWTIKIRDGIEFTDGTPLNADAVKFNWERLADPATGALSMQVAQGVSSMTVVDDTTLEVVLAEPNGQFLRTIANSALQWIASPAALQADPGRTKEILSRIPAGRWGEPQDPAVPEVGLGREEPGRLVALQPHAEAGQERGHAVGDRLAEPGVRQGQARPAPGGGGSGGRARSRARSGRASSSASRSGRRSPAASPPL